MKININRKVLRWAVPPAAVFFIFGGMIFIPRQAVSRGYDYNQASKVEGISIIASDAKTQVKNNPKSGSITVKDIPVDPAAHPFINESYDLSSIKAGVYVGPGAVSSHNNFENWLGKPVPYALDYIDYKNGWTADFHDSSVWLAKPWGKWVNQGNRRLVLGLPMLESANAGQFDKGINGDFDSYFRDLAGQLVANGLGNSIIRLGYEANCSTIGPWQALDNPNGYKQLFRHEVAVMRSVPGTTFAFDWTVCNGLQNGHALSSFNSFYPGDDVVDIIGIDVYDVKWQDPSATPPSRWNYIVSRQMGVNELVSFARSHGKPLSFPEWGLYAPGDSFAGGGDNPYFIQKMAGLFTSTKPLYQSYFDLDWGGGVLSDFKQGQSVFKQIFGA